MLIKAMTPELVVSTLDCSMQSHSSATEAPHRHMAPSVDPAVAVAPRAGRPDSGRSGGLPGEAEDRPTQGIQGEPLVRHHLSNTTCLTHVFLKSGR